MRDRETEPGPAAGRAGRPIEALEHVRQVLRTDARAVVLDGERRAAPHRPATATPTRPSVGLWRIALSTRIMTSWRSRAGSPATTAGCGIDHDPDAAVGGRLAQRRRAVGGDVAEVDGTCSSATAPESERASSSRSSTIAVMWRTSSSMSSSADADRRDGLVPVALEVLDAAPDDGQRRPQLVARVGRELALAAQGGRWLASDSRIGTSARRA